MDLNTVDERDTLIRGASLVGGKAIDLLLSGGMVAETGARLQAPAGAHVVDAGGLVALPGFVDLHTHLREPGREDAETVESGTRAAALGGFTAVHAMANTDPVADTAGVVEQVWRLGRESGWCDVAPVGAVSSGLKGEQLAELGAMAESAARVRVFSDDGRCVSDPVLMRRALEYVKAFDGVIAQHAEEPRLTVGSQMNEGVISARLGLTGWPAVAEESIIARDVLLAGHVGSRLHVCHVSTAGSVEILRWAKAKGWRVTAEVTPHHLLLTDDFACGYDPVYKVNPPLRTAEDVAALREGLLDGTIDAVATDHAPHALEDKEAEWAAARPGMLGLQTALGIVMLALGERFSWELAAERMSYAPAEIGRLRTHGRPLDVGAPANLTLVDPSQSWVVDPAGLASRSRNTPYAGRELPATIVATFLRGRATVLDGKTALGGKTALDGKTA
ncbi:MAG TPA: dihydroorotase [Frankiaceae bacterium]|jgi:dihydroorotase|nr:dihydroorotase [Frankiaceae bacterium]